MLFLGLGTGLGTTMIVDGIVAPMEVGHLPYKKGRTFEDYVGVAGLKRLGRRKWQAHVFDVVARLQNALLPDYVVLGGGNVYSPPFVSWTYQEMLCRRKVATEIKGFSATQPGMEAVHDWTQSTSSDALTA